MQFTLGRAKFWLSPISIRHMKIREVVSVSPKNKRMNGRTSGNRMASAKYFIAMERKSRPSRGSNLPARATQGAMSTRLRWVGEEGESSHQNIIVRVLSGGRWGTRFHLGGDGEPGYVVSPPPKFAKVDERA